MLASTALGVPTVATRFGAAVEVLAESARLVPPALTQTASSGHHVAIMDTGQAVREPRVVIFDEATSALDNQTQAVVSRSLESLGVTRIVIAHRLSTIRHADRIYVIEKGRIVEQGRFEELAAAGGLFDRLMTRQAL